LWTGWPTEVINLSTLSYAAVQGYIRARLSRLLDAAIWARLLEANSFTEIGQSLGETAIALAVARDGGISVQVLRGQTAAAGRALARFLPRASRELFAWYNRRFEIENLKIILRAVHYQADRRRALAALIPLRPARWPWEALLEAESVDAVIDRVRESSYRRPLENAVERYRKERRLFYLEVALDLFYFQKLVRLIELQSGRDLDAVKQAVEKAAGHPVAMEVLKSAGKERGCGPEVRGTPSIPKRAAGARSIAM
jgi:V/A-type H+-transporting ATPase subunit C